MSKEKIHEISRNVEEKQDNFNEYLDKTFGGGTSQKLEALLTSEVRTEINPLDLADRATERVIIFGDPGFKNPEDRQKAINANEQLAREVLKDNNFTGKYIWTAHEVKWAATHIVLTGKKFWGGRDEKLMKKALDFRAKESLEIDRESGRKDPDTIAVYQAGIAASYRLLFNVENYHLNGVRMIRGIENEMSGHIGILDEINPSTVAPFSSRAATLRILMASEIIPIKGGIKIVDPKPSQRFRV